MDYEKLNEILKDEFNDVVMYASLYKTSENPIFRDIAREEMTHAKHIKHILKGAGKLKDCTEIMDKAKTALNEI